MAADTDQAAQVSGEEPKESVARVTRLHAPNADIGRIARALCSWYETKKLESQVLEEGDSVTVQARSPGWRKIVGMSLATTVLLRQDGKQVVIEIGGAKWGDKGAVAGAGLLLAPILVVPAGIGAFKQRQLPRETVNFIKSQIGDEPEVKAKPAIGLKSETVKKSQESPSKKPMAKVDLNTADQGEIATLPGMDRVTADKVVRERERTGGFRSIEAAAEVMAPHVFARIEDSVRVSELESSRKSSTSRRKIGF